MHGLCMENRGTCLGKSLWKVHGHFMEKASNNPAGPKKTAMETPCKMHGTFMENRGTYLGKFLWKVHGIFMEKASKNPAENLKVRRCPHPRSKQTTMETSWNMHGKFIDNHGYFVGKFLWTVHEDFMEKASNNLAGKLQKTKQPWKLHGTCMEHSLKLLEAVC